MEPIVDGFYRQTAQTNNETCFPDQQRWEIIDLRENLEDADGYIAIEVVENYIRNCDSMVEDPIVPISSEFESPAGKPFSIAS